MTACHMHWDTARVAHPVDVDRSRQKGLDSCGVASVARVVQMGLGKAIIIVSCAMVGAVVVVVVVVVVAFFWTVAILRVARIAGCGLILWLGVLWWRDGVCVWKESGGDRKGKEMKKENGEERREKREGRKRV